MHFPSRRVTAVMAAITTGAVLGAPMQAVAAGSAEPQAHHQADLSKSLQRSIAAYRLSDVTLVREDGKNVKFPREIDDGRPVILNFIFTSCSSVCPLASAVFGQLQSRLGPDRDRVHLVSISIDPEQDTPRRLLEYARRFGAGPEWRHYTGSVQASIALQRDFNVYRGDKMSHTPVTLLRAAPGEPWVRLDGFATANDLYSEYQLLTASR